MRLVNVDVSLYEIYKRMEENMNIPKSKKFKTICGEKIKKAEEIFEVYASALPTVDAVPVVRCRDCLYYQQLGRCGARSESYTDPDGFCHMGVKKEEEA